MKRLNRRGTVCAAVVMAAALVVGVWSPDVSADPTTEYVIVVVIDGLRCYEAFHNSPASDYVECMRDSLAPLGTRYQNFWNNGEGSVQKTTSAPSPISRRSSSTTTRRTATARATA